MKIIKSIAIGFMAVILSVGIAAACYIPVPTCEELQNCEVTPTETPTPSETPAPTDAPVVYGLPGDGLGGTEYHTATCNGIYPDKPVIREDLYQKTSGTSAHFGFYPVKADSYIVTYGYSKDHLDYGIPYLGSDSTGFDISNLKPGFSYLYARVTARIGECYTSSDVAN